MTDKLDAIPGSTGRKIIDGLKDAVAGNFASVTIEGQRWVRADAPAALQVWLGPMPESNGRSNFTAILHRGDLVDGHTIARSEYPDRVRYEADRVRFLLGELSESPDILAYDADKHSGYVEPQRSAAMTDAPTHAMAIAGARSIGNTAHDENHMVRARACWKAMNAARDGIEEPRPSGEQAAQSTAMTVDPVGYVSPRTMQVLATAEGAGPVVACAGYDTTIPVYATPPSSGNADAVRIIDAKIEALKKIAGWQTGIRRSQELDIVIGYLVGVRNDVAALSSAPVAGEWKEALKPLAELSLWRDSYPDGPDIIGDQRLQGYFTPDQVRAARAALSRNERVTPSRIPETSHEA